MGILLDAFSLTPARAVEYLRKRKLQVSGGWTEIWKEQHTKVFTVANVSKLDLLQDIRTMVNAAVDGEMTTDSSGKRAKRAIPFQEFKKRFRKNIAKRGWFIEQDEVVDPKTGEIISNRLGSVARMRTIFDTNVQTAYMAGRYKGQADVVQDLPYWQYIAIADSRTTHRCSALNGQVFAATDPVWDTIYTPNHWHCRSRVRALTRKQVDRDDIVVQENFKTVTTKDTVGPKSNRREVDVKGIRFTGDDGQQHTFMPDAGWDYNPGKASFKPDLNRYDDDIANLWEEQ